MIILRLLRRVLFCFAVGVTAFGVSGWLLRPTANWTRTFDDHRLAGEFVKVERELAADEPIWFKHAGQSNEEETRTFVAFDPADGQELSRFTLTASEVETMTVGSCGVLATVVPLDERLDRRFRGYDGRTGATTFDRTLPGSGWRCEDGGARAYRHETKRNGFVLHLVDLLTGGESAREMTIPNTMVWGLEADLCPDGRTYVTCEVGDERPSWSILVWDVETCKLIARATPPLPKQFKMGCIERLRFLSGGRYIEVDLRAASNFEVDDGELSRCIYDLKLDTYLDDDWTPEPPTSANTGGPPREMEAGEPIQCWSIQPKETEDLYFTLVQNRTTTVPWRRFPYPAQNRVFACCFSTSAPAIVGTTIPGRTELVMKSFEPPLSSMAPEFVRTWIAPTSSLSGDQQRMRWHDWRANTWRVVGCGGDVAEYQVRPNALITMTHDGENGVSLQSWPLPPRDPKWLAAAIALSCSAALWFLCARRTARRMKSS